MTTDKMANTEITELIVNALISGVISKVDEKYSKAEARLRKYVSKGYLIDAGNHYEVNYIPFSTYRKKVSVSLINGVLHKDLAVDVLY